MPSPKRWPAIDVAAGDPALLTDQVAHTPESVFAQDWAQLWPPPPSTGAADRFGLAVSGGPDSLALLVLAQAALGADRIAVATVDHGLRADSAAEAQGVAQVCNARGIAHTTLTLALAHGAAVQERARTARYHALAGWAGALGLSALVTAHHADDQAETLIMRMNRGAGLRGLAGIRPRATVPGHPLPLLRPLLAWRRADLLAVVDHAGLVAKDDPSNRDARFERVRVRAGLASAPWLQPAGLAAAAMHLAEADAALEWATDQAWARLIMQGDGTIVLDRGVFDRGAHDPALPRALALRVLERVIARLGGAGVTRGGDVARWHDRLTAGEVATLAGVRGDGRGRAWHFAPAPPHRGV
ncbi:tRNA lysidine(34) synthetase TilS [Novosphingobium sp.]|uniref:tRNA lysidine(34) synthetase TilS n=1 Tax=Novosphingobium sp. TaxID=1874826 RepID=UPI00333EB103